MFGLREEFSYFQCTACRCLQIRSIPAEMSRYYPSNYYSMQARLPAVGPLARGVRALEWEARRRVHNRLFGEGRRSRIFEWMQVTGTAYHNAILDVGCGIGRLLHELHLYGFRNLTGADPFVARELRYDNGIVIQKCDVGQLPGSFDLIMMHHVFEHLPQPERAMADAASRLAPGRYLVLRIPVIDCYAWRHYGVDWLALDAPRHFYLHSERSIGLLAKRTGFRVERVNYDSGPHQLWGSEQYQRDIPHRSANSHEENRWGSVFSRAQIRAFKRKTAELNAARDGDSACFYLRKN